MRTTNLTRRAPFASQPFVLNQANQGFLEGWSERLAGYYENMILLTLGIVAISLCVIGFAAVSWDRWQRRLDYGVTTWVVVVSQRVADGRTKTTFVTYRYDAPFKGKTMTYTTEESVDAETFYQLREGTRVAVRYLIAAPWDATIQWRPERPRTIPIILGVATSCLIAALVGLAKIWQALRLLTREGWLIAGWVVSCDSSTDSKGNLSLSLRYAFTTLDGRQIEGSDSGTRNDLRSSTLPTPGMLVAVLYLSERVYQLL